MHSSDYYHENYETPLQFHVLPWLWPWPLLIGTAQMFVKRVVFPAPMLPPMVSIGTHIFTTILHNTFEAISTNESFNK